MSPLVDKNDVEHFRTLIARHLGLLYDDRKLDYLADVLHRRMEVAGIGRFDAYREQLVAPNKSELRAVAEQITVNETFFFRNADNFRAFAEEVLPARIRARSREKRLSILSAGCASGEEPYSLAIAVREALPDVESWDVQILAVDVNPAVLAKAGHARYSAWSLRATPEDARRRYFRQEGRDFVLEPSIRTMVRFEERNLVDDDAFWIRLACDVVFCRNVVMYFTPDRVRDVVLRLRRALVPGGYLFLGHAETLRGLTNEFHLCHTHDTFYYRLRAASETVDPSTSLASATDRVLPAVVDSSVSWIDAIQGASERIATLARLAPQREPGTPAPVARTWDLGVVLEAMRQERFADALELVTALPPDVHDTPDALLLRAVLLTNCGKLEDAEQVARRLLDLDELNAGAHYLVALCREHAGDTTGAVEHDQTAIYLDAAFAMPHLHLGIMAKRSREPALVERELGQALVLLAREDVFRVLLFGGGFSRETLVELCRTELRVLRGER